MKLENVWNNLNSAEQFEPTKLHSNRLDVKMHFASLYLNCMTFPSQI